MNSSKLLIAVLVALLIVSIGANVFLYTQTLTSQGSSDATKVDMVATLSSVQVSVDAEIERISNSVVYASQQLTSTGITGDQARAVIAALAANSSFIVEAATQNLDRQMMVVEPEAWHTSEGKTIGEQKWLNPNPAGAITPCMTPVIMLITNQSGCSIVAPVFDSNKVMVGTVSAIFSPQRMINTSITSAAPNSPYSFTATQTDGLVVYSGNAAFQNRNLLTDPTLDTFPGIDGIRASSRLTSSVSSGYNAYNVGTQQRESYWTTISAYGQEWRLIIHHAI